MIATDFLQFLVVLRDAWGSLYALKILPCWLMEIPERGRERGRERILFSHSFGIHDSSRLIFESTNLEVRQSNEFTTLMSTDKIESKEKIQRISWHLPAPLRVPLPDVPGWRRNGLRPLPWTDDDSVLGKYRPDAAIPPPPAATSRGIGMPWLSS